MLENLEALLSILDYSINTKNKRHIAGGILISISLFFTGLAITTLTFDIEKENEDE